MLSLKRTIQAATIAIVATAALLFHQTAPSGATLLFQQSSHDAWKTQASNYAAEVNALGLAIPVGDDRFQIQLQNAKHRAGFGMEQAGRAQQFHQLVFSEVLPGIDLLYHSSPSQSVEFDFQVAAGADPDVIHMDFGAAQSPTLRPDGALSVHYPSAEMRMPAPVAWQEVQGRRVYVDARYRLNGRFAGFELGRYDRTKALLIDPTVLVVVPLEPLRQSFLNQASASDAAAGRAANALAISPDGSLYLAGRNHAWVSKMNAGGDAEVFRANLGENVQDAVNALALDATGNSYASGSRWVGGVEQGFTAKLDGAGNQLSYTPLRAPAAAMALGARSEVYWAAGSEVALEGGWKLAAPGPVRALAVDSQGTLYAAGSRVSAPESSQSGDHAWVARVDIGENGARWSWTLPLAGGGSLDEARALAPAPDGSIYVGGITNSSNFPVHDAAQAGLSGLQDGFIARIRPDGSGTDWATYLGGTGMTTLSALAVDAGGNLMVAGGTDVPKLAPAPGSPDRQDGFFARLDATGKVLDIIHAESAGPARFFAVASAPDGQAYVAGSVSTGSEDVLTAKVTGSNPALSSLSPSASGVHSNAVSALQSLKFIAQPPNGVAGVALSSSVKVQVLDGTGNPVTNSSIAITVAAVPGTLTATANAVNGIATFSNLVLLGAGSHTLSATAAGLTGASSASFTIAPNTAYKLGFAAAPADGVAGATLPAVDVQVQDQYGNLVDASLPVKLEWNNVTTGSQGTFGTSTAVKGVAEYRGLTLTTAGSYHLSASQALQPLQVITNLNNIRPVRSVAFVIGPGAAAGATFSTPPVNGYATVALPAVVVQMIDAWGNPSTDQGWLVNVKSSPAGVAASTSVSTGGAKFSNLVFSTPGTYTLIATASSTSLNVSYTATSAPFTVATGPGIPARLKFTVPANGFIGTALQVTVRVLDSQSLPVKGTSVTVTSTPAGVAISGTSDIGGDIQFSSLPFTSPNNYTLTASTSNGITASAPIRIDFPAGTPSHISFVTQPVNYYAGGTLPTVTVQVTDYLNTPLTGPVVTLKSQNAVSVTATAVNGVAQFSNVVFPTSGFFTLTANTTNNISVVSDRVSMDVLPPSQLVFYVQPSDGTAGQAISPAVVVAVEDSAGHMGHTLVPVTLTLQQVGGPTVTATVIADGKATFTNLVITHSAKSYRFVASSSFGNIPATLSNTFKVVPGAAAQLVFKVPPPATANVNVPLSPAVVVWVVDAYGNLEDEASGRIISLSGPPDGSEVSSNIYVSGTTKVTTTNGIATFSNVFFNQNALLLKDVYLVASSGKPVTPVQSPVALKP